MSISIDRLIAKHLFTGADRYRRAFRHPTLKTHMASNYPFQFSHQSVQVATFDIKSNEDGSVHYCRLVTLGSQASIPTTGSTPEEPQR